MFDWFLNQMEVFAKLVNGFGFFGYQFPNDFLMFSEGRERVHWEQMCQ